MVDQVMSWQPLSAPVAAAMHKVERHLFVPHVPVEQAYVNDSVVIKGITRSVAFTRNDGHGAGVVRVDSSADRESCSIASRGCPANLSGSVASDGGRGPSSHGRGRAYGDHQLCVRRRRAQ